MGKELKRLNLAWDNYRVKHPNADYGSFLAGWDAAAYDYVGEAQ